MNKTKIILPAIFLLAMVIRFLYFPNNIYFGFDQARDAYVAQDLLNGDLKLIGPSTSFEGLYHGVLYYYLLAPLYGLGDKSTEFVAAVWRILNSLGIFLIFYITKILFDKKTALFTAILFAFSFEQTQFSIYLHHPSLGVLSILVMYLGLAKVVFRNICLGLPLAFLGLGFSIQSEFVLTYLTVPFVLIILLFRQRFFQVPLKIWLISIMVLTISLSSFILAEFKYNFRTINSLVALSGFNPGKTLDSIIQTYLFTVSKMGSYNIWGDFQYKEIVLVLLTIIYIILLIKKIYLKQLIFLSVWFFSLILTLVVHGGVENLQKEIPLYYPNVGVSIALLIFISLIIEKVIKKNIFLGLLIVAIIIYSNLTMITKLNPKGTISEINVQQGMLLSDQKKVLDYIYQDANSEPFAVKAVTMPLYINTTWSYLFEWYGQNNFGYLPIWNGKNAVGFAGNLKVEEAQEKLPSRRYVIIEPTRGIATYLIDDFLKEEGYFTKIVEEEKFGMFVVQKREKF